MILVKKAVSFELKSTDEKILKLDDIKGENGTLIMFICNHCPYVKAVTKDIVENCNNLKKIGINSIAICSNDAINYPEDSFENMISFEPEAPPSPHSEEDHKYIETFNDKLQELMMREEE